MIIQIPRNRGDTTKVETKILCQTGSIQIKENGETQKYYINGAVTHKGALAGNGHYISSYYDSRDMTWKTIDDNIITAENVEENMMTGTIYILLKENNIKKEEKIRGSYRETKIHPNTWKVPDSRPISTRSSKDHNNVSVSLTSTNKQRQEIQTSRGYSVQKGWKDQEAYNSETQYENKEFPALRLQSPTTYKNKRYYADIDEPESRYHNDEGYKLAENSNPVYGYEDQNIHSF